MSFVWPAFSSAAAEVLDHVEVQIVQPPDVGLGEFLVGEIRERRPAPQAERGSQGGHAYHAIAGCDPGCSFPDQLLELVRVDRSRRGLQLVAGLAGDDQ